MSKYRWNFFVAHIKTYRIKEWLNFSISRNKIHNKNTICTFTFSLFSFCTQKIQIQHFINLVYKNKILHTPQCSLSLQYNIFYEEKKEVIAHFICTHFTWFYQCTQWMFSCLSCRRFTGSL